MTAITQDTFKALNRFVGVRLQQGVPLVDADWNELEDVRRFELRAFLKWFVGDGVPYRNDGFAIQGGGAVDDFRILAGSQVGTIPDALRDVGRIVVDGLDVMIEADVTFTGQKLHTKQGAAADAEAARLGFPGPALPKIGALPAVNGPVTVYLDVWERLVTPTEEPGLVLPGLGTESCARHKREWVVRARPGVTTPQASDTDFITGHSYYALATIRRQGAGPVNPVDITDRREKNLMMAPGTLVDDTLGVGLGQYRAGAARPLASLREAINALLRGELPSTAETALAPAAGLDLVRRACAFDGAGGLIATWASTRSGQSQIYVSRAELANLAAGFSAPAPITSGVPCSEPHLTVLLGVQPEVVAVYTSNVGANRDIKFKRAAFGGLGAAVEVAVATTAGVVERSPWVLRSGATRLAFLYANVDQWTVRVYDVSANGFPGAPVLLASSNTVPDNGDFDLHAAVDAAGNVWAAWSSTSNRLHLVTYTPASGNRTNETDFTSPTHQKRPFVLCAANNTNWLFWDSDAGIQFTRFRAGWGAPAPVTGTVAGDREPAAVEAPDGGIWVFFTRGAALAGDVLFTRLDPVTLTWGQLRQATFGPKDDSAPFALADSSGAAYLFWLSDRTNDIDVFYKRLLTQI
jgi:hypothetical protein